jgi:putative membrane protein
MVVGLITRILAVALVLLLVAEYVPGIQVDGVYPAIVSAVILGILNAVVRPILVVLTLPISLLTLGLFVFVINAGLFWFAASFIQGFTVSSFFAAIVGSLVVSIVGALSSRYINNTTPSPYRERRNR